MGQALAAGLGLGRPFADVLGDVLGVALAATVAVAVSVGAAVGEDDSDATARAGVFARGVLLLHAAASAAITTHEVRTRRR